MWVISEKQVLPRDFTPTSKYDASLGPTITWQGCFCNSQATSVHHWLSCFFLSGSYLKMASCGCVPLRPSRSGSVWLRMQCFSVIVRPASNGSAPLDLTLDLAFNLNKFPYICLSAHLFWMWCDFPATQQVLKADGWWARPGPRYQ